MNFTESLLASLAAGAIWAILYALVTRHVIPMIRGAIGDELNLEGQWNSQLVTPAGNPHDLTLELKQRWRRLEGRMTVVKHIPTTGATEIKTYGMHGDLRDRFVLLQGRNMDKRAVGVDTELLEVISDGRMMRGVTAWYSISGKTITSCELEWTRVGSAQLNPTS